MTTLGKFLLIFWNSKKTYPMMNSPRMLPSKLDTFLFHPLLYKMIWINYEGIVDTVVIHMSQSLTRYAVSCMLVPSYVISWSTNFRLPSHSLHSSTFPWMFSLCQEIIDSSIWKGKSGSCSPWYFFTNISTFYIFINKIWVLNYTLLCFRMNKTSLLLIL